MLGKRYSLGDTFEATGEQTVSVADFEKLATEDETIAEFISSFTPDPKYMYLHVIALGAGEVYGCNQNGDYFPEADLIARHKTFETDASVFMEHANKPYDKHYGKVAFAWYNHKMRRCELILQIDKIAGKEFVDRVERGERLAVSMGCFPVGTDILLDDNTFKRIEYINPGDKVITHTGEVHEVTTKMLHEHTGNMCKIKVSGQTEPLICTDNHPILVRKYNGVVTDIEGNCPVCNKHVKQIFTHVFRSKNKEHIEYIEDAFKNKYNYLEYWTEAKNIKPGDFLVTPITQVDNKQHKENIDLAKIIGYFLAEGSYIKYKPKNKKKKYIAIQFNFHKDEINLHNDVLSSLKVLSEKIPTYQIREKKTLAVISLYDVELSNKILSLCGEYSKYKVLNSDILSWTLEEKLYVLGCYFDGDGTFSKIHHTISATTISKNLAYSITALANSCGIGAKISSYNGQYNKSYIIVINPEDTSKLKNYCDKIPEDFTYNTVKYGIKTVFVDKSCIVKKVSSIETYHVDNLPVYNLSVEGDESYTANSIAVHNCRVKFDVCSICGNKAAKPSDYCSHIRLHKKEIFPDGKQAYMINYNPTFNIKRRA